MKKSNITVIIPVHELNENTIPLFKKSIDSVVNQTEQPKELLIVGPEAVAKYVKDEILPNVVFNIRVVKNTGETDFASQMNLGVKNTKTEWFCMLEFDDELSNKWLENAEKYTKKNEDVGVFLPIIINYDEKNDFIGFSNEAVWATEFSMEMGIVDNSTLLGYQGINVDGMVMRKDLYEEHGGFKPSMKFSFIYEFLLRMTYFSVRFMVIPKFGYKHFNLRTDSLFANYNKELSADETRWWMSLSKKEYFHTKDRGLTYEGKTK